MLSAAAAAQRLAAPTAVWTALFVGTRFVVFPKRSADFSNRVVSIAHALLAILLAAPALDWAHPLASVGAANTAAQTRCMEVSLAYFVYDLLVCLVIDPEPVGLVHHLCTIAGLAVGVLQGKCGTELVACLLLMEVSNPSMHLNQLLKELGASGSPLATANQLVFALLFFLCRLCVGPLVVHAAVTSTTTPTVVKAGGLGILVVSLVWFRKIVAVAMHKARKSRSQAKKR